MHLWAEGIKCREKSEAYPRNDFRVASVHMQEVTGGIKYHGLESIWRTGGPWNRDLETTILGNNGSENSDRVCKEIWSGQPPDPPSER